jgi:methionine biosynthesis protein MetW
MEKPMNNIQSIRKDWDLIESLITEKSRILDIGCGEGDLIQQLEKNLEAHVHGIEKNQDMALKGIAKGLNITHGDAETDLSQYANQSFDYVILSQTLQAMIEPKKILAELLRVGSKAIVSFPNFGHWKIRLQLLLWGKMPITEGLPYTWYDTPNIHFFTLKDFENLCKEMNIVIENSIGLTNKGKQFYINDSLLPANIITHEAIFLLSYKNFEPIKIKSTNKIFAKKSAIIN